MDMYKAQHSRYDVPLDHLDYDYIGKCTDIKEMEKIVKILRGGYEGSYPDLQKFAEQQLESLAPKSRVLRKSEKLKSVKDLDPDESKEIIGNLESWTSQIKNVEETLKKSAGEDDGLPAVRGATTHIPLNKAAESQTEKKSSKRVKPRDYREWDMIDVDAELAKVDKEEVKVTENKQVLRKAKKPEIPATVDTTGLTDEEKEKVAEREKSKGNESFRSGDCEEALLYYNRSISVVPSIAAINNRAQTYVKLKKWDEAISDCTAVLREDNSNVKALLRRAVAHQGKKEFKKARQDLDHVLHLEPNNKRAQDLQAEVDKAIGEQKKKGRRMIIEDVEGSDNELEKRDEEKPEKEKISTKEEKSVMHELNLEKKHDGKKILIEEMESNVTDIVVENDSNMAKDNVVKMSDGSEIASINQESVKNYVKVTEYKVEKEGKVTENKVKVNQDSEKKDVSSPKKSKNNKKETVKKSDISSSSSLDGEMKKEAVSMEMIEQLEADVKQVEEEKVEIQQITEAARKQVSEAKAELERKQKELATAEEAIKTSLGDLTASPAPSQASVPQQPLPEAATKVKQQGNDLFKTGQYSEAATKYTKVIDLIKNDKHQTENLSVIYSNRAACYSKMGDCSSCVKDCNEALSLTPGAIKALIRRAQAYEVMEKYSKAYVDYSQALYIDSSIDVVLQSKNRCMKHLQEQHGAKWREKLPPIVPVTLLNSQPITASLTSQQPITKQHTSSHTSCQPVISQNTTLPTQPDQSNQPSLDPEVEFEKLNERGRKFVEKQDFTNAAEIYSMCIKLRPSQTVAYTNRALCNLRLNKPRLVVEDCTQALNLDNDNIKALFRRSQGYKLLGDYQSSKGDLEKLLKLEQKNTAARKELQLVDRALEEEKHKSTPTQNTSKHKKLQIQEVDSSDSDDEQSDISQKTVAMKAGPKSSTATQEKVASESDNKTDSEKSSDKEAASQQAVSQSKTSCTPGKAEATIVEDKKMSPVPSFGKVTTAYEFIQAWTSLKNVSEPEPYAKLIEQIEPQDFPKVISNKLDSSMLKMIIKCIEVFIDEGKLSQSLAYLQHLPSVPRFQVITMFMSSQETADLNSLLKKFEELGNCEYLTQDLQKLRKTYGLDR